jgi:hypothetical protein
VPEIISVVDGISWINPCTGAVSELVGVDALSRGLHAAGRVRNTTKARYKLRHQRPGNLIEFIDQFMQLTII